MMFVCPVCKEFESHNLDSLRIHCAKKHKLTARGLYVMLFLGGTEPTCACGCGNAVTFNGVHKGFATYCRGHVARIHNNWGHNEKVLKKSQIVRKSMHDRGEICVWNRGKTKQTDERIAKYAQKNSQFVLSDPKNVAKRSERMRKHRLDGTIRTLMGKEHPNWQGGVSTVQGLARSRLYSVWTFPIMKAANFVCVDCGSRKHICVHHDSERFADIMHKIVGKCNVLECNFETLSKFVNDIVSYHVINQVSGVCLCENCHKRIHSLC